MIPFETVAFMPQLAAVILFVLLVLCGGSRASAQPPVPENLAADQQNRIGESHFKYVGHFEYERGDVKLYSDTADLFRDDNRLILEGNVVMRQGNNQISADRAEFNTSTRVGTFYTATGFATIQPPKQQARPGGVAPPPVVGQENIVYFFGEKVVKSGPKRYRITNGGFTTCVQPTPRWDLRAGTIVLNVDHYTLLRNAVMNVKGVPMFYLPAMYYPTKKGERATGFLLPAYGTSTLRGQSLHNAFFWAIDRSQDATFLSDWFSKTGQGTGGEYRYNFGGGSDGTIRAYMLNEHATSYINGDGSETFTPDTRSYEVHGAASQTLPGNLRARARVDYFSSLVANQTFNTNVNDASRSQRSFGGNVVGGWGGYSVNGTFDHNEYFYSQSSSNVSGSWPRFTVTRNERPIANTPFYLSAGGEYAHILSDSINIDGNNVRTEVDQSLTRLDFTPQIRFPFKKWQWFTVNSTAGWRDTYYTRSYDPATIDPTGAIQPVVIDSGLNRHYFTLQSQITGPVFSRIWDTPQNGYAEKFKHSVEPYLNIQRTSSIDGYDRIVKLEGTDQVVGGTTQLTYGFTNRFYAKRRAAAPGQLAQAREVVTVDIQQTYYTNDLASTVDRQYQTSNTGTTPSNFSPIALSVRAQPTNDFNATFRAEFDATYRALRTLSATGSYNWSTVLQSSAGWSKVNYIPELTPYDNSTESINGSANAHTRDNKYGLLYSFNFDVLRTTLIQERVSAFYNAQCCGLAFEYQVYNFPTDAGFAIPSDHRFFLSFTLAGLGNFSPFSGALGGVPR